MPAFEDFEANTDDAALKKKADRNSPRQRAVRVLVFWLVFLGIVFAFSAAPIARTLSETDFVSKVSGISAARRRATTVSLNAAFARTTDGTTFHLKGFPATVAGTGVDTAHNVVECLLDGTSTEAAQEGYVSLFPSGTKLNGLTISCGCAFVDLSSEFLSVERTWGENGPGAAAMQIKLSLQGAGYEVDEVVILVDGVETYCF